MLWMTGRGTSVTMRPRTVSPKDPIREEVAIRYFRCWLIMKGVTDEAGISEQSKVFAVVV
jgi:hypothetical protein